MFEPHYTKQFERDVRKIKKSGSKDLSRLKSVIRTLIEEKLLEKKHKDHALTGLYKDRRECHIGPDWLLVYKIDKEKGIIIFERTGSHSELFK